MRRAAAPGRQVLSDCGAPVAIEPASERRLVTVVFVDLVGSTKLAVAPGPRTLPRGARGVPRMVTEEVEWLRGRAESFIGDAVLTVFGVPTSHDDDAVRAIRAGALRGGPRAAAGARARPPVPHARCTSGINTGLVAVGTAADRGIVIGGEVNIGARLQQAAEPGEVLVGSTTRQLVKDAVEFGEMRMIAPEGVRRRDRRVAGDPSGAALDALDDPVRGSAPRARAADRHVRARAGAPPRAPGDAARRAGDRQDARGRGVPRRPGRRA